MKAREIRELTLEEAVSLAMFLQLDHEARPRR